MIDEVTVEETSTSSSSSSKNSSSSDDDSQCLMVRDVEIFADSYLGGFDNGINEPEVPSRFNSNSSNTLVLSEHVSDIEDTLVRIKEIEQIMVDYK